MCPTMTSQAQQ